MKEIKLTNGQVAKVCDCHYHLVKDYKWYAYFDKHSNGYRAARRATIGELIIYKKATILMHSVINGTPKGMHTDHVDNDLLNNQCANLRTSTVSENMRNRGKTINNRSGYKGVRWHKRDKKWVAQITLEGTRTHLGYFDSASDAARAYDEAAKQLHGPFAKTNL